MEKELSLYVTHSDNKRRIDIFVSEKAKISRNLTQKLIEEGLITLNKESAKYGCRIKEGDIIHVRVPHKRDVGIEKQDIPLNIVYEDKDILVINKQRGMVVHPSAGHKDGTLVNALMYQVDDLSGIGGEDRPGIVHRLDKNTSGLLIIAKNDNAHRRLSDMFKTKTISKEYIAIIHGKLRGREGIINLPVGRNPKDRKLMAVVNGGKNAVTRWKVRKVFGDYSLVSLFPETGRTHQLRVHLKHVGNPVVGDPEYSKMDSDLFNIEGQALHAIRIAFNHPSTGKKLEFEVPIPDDIQEIIDKLESIF
ncbi:MAG: RluA family pseudouridine synthase [Candidatus Eremiobacteraeota bacterium]|nr:RluA family pseudouridine synthase [Candidatus Eremiobacteraeota bacterium]